MMLRWRTRKRLNNLLFIIIPFLCGLLLYFLFFNTTGNVVKDIKSDEINKLNNLDIDPLSIDGLKKVEVGITPGIMMLLDNCTGIVMVTTRSQTFSIMRGKEKVQDVRPNAHDLIQDMVNNLDIEVLMVKVTGNFEEMYYAGLFFKKDNKILNLDARPSDALSIATRLSVPVYVDEKLFEKQKQKVC